MKQNRDSHSRRTLKKQLRQGLRIQESILKLETHRQKQTYPKTFRYDAKAKIRADEDFKEEIKTIRKQAEQKLLEVH